MFLLKQPIYIYISPFLNSVLIFILYVFSLFMYASLGCDKLLINERDDDDDDDDDDVCNVTFLLQVQTEVRKKWQQCRSALNVGGFASRRLTTTATQYAAVPPNDTGHHPHRGRATSQQPARPDQQTTHEHAPAHHLQTPNNADVIDDTVTSWIPNDATRHGCHGDDDADDDSQQQHGGVDAVRMTRLNHDRC